MIFELVVVGWQFPLTAKSIQPGIIVKDIILLWPWPPHTSEVT